MSRTGLFALLLSVALIAVATPAQAGHDEDAIPDEVEIVCTSQGISGLIATVDGATGAGKCAADGSGDFEQGESPSLPVGDADGDGLPDSVESAICGGTPPVGSCEGDDYTFGLPAVPGAEPRDAHPCRTPNSSWADVVYYLLNDADCDGDTNQYELENGCNPLDAEEHPHSGGKDCTLGDGFPPEDTPPEEVGEHCGHSPSEATRFVWSILGDADCDGRTNQEEVEDVTGPLPPIPV